MLPLFKLSTVQGCIPAVRQFRVASKKLVFLPLTSGLLSLGFSSSFLSKPPMVYLGSLEPFSRAYRISIWKNSYRIREIDSFYTDGVTDLFGGRDGIYMRGILVLNRSARVQSSLPPITVHDEKFPFSTFALTGNLSTVAPLLAIWNLLLLPNPLFKLWHAIGSATNCTPLCSPNAYSVRRAATPSSRTCTLLSHSEKTAKPTPATSSASSRSRATRSCPSTR